METIDLRPMTLGELLDRTFTLYRRHFGTFVGIMAVPQAVALVLVIGVLAVGMAGRDSPPAMLAAGLVVGIGYLIAYVMAQAATVFAVSDLYLGKSTSLRQCYGRVGKYVGRMILLLIMLGLAMMGGFLLLIIPGFYVLARTAVAVPAAVVEDLKANDAFNRSMSLTKGHAGRSLVIFIFVLVITWAASLVFELPFAAMQEINKQGPPSFALLLANQISSLVAGLLVGPIGTIAFALFYYDLRVRKEAFDLQVMMRALDPSADVPAAAGSGAAAPKQFS